MSQLCFEIVVIVKHELIKYPKHIVYSLLTSFTENIENTLWSAIRGVEESIILHNNLGDHYAEKNQPKLAAMYFRKASEAEVRAKLVRQAVCNTILTQIANIDVEQLPQRN